MSICYAYYSNGVQPHGKRAEPKCVKLMVSMLHFHRISEFPLVICLSWVCMVKMAALALSLEVNMTMLINATEKPSINHPRAT